MVVQDQEGKAFARDRLGKLQVWHCLFRMYNYDTACLWAYVCNSFLVNCMAGCILENSVRDSYVFGIQLDRILRLRR